MELGTGPQWRPHDGDRRVQTPGKGIQDPRPRRDKQGKERKGKIQGEPRTMSNSK